MFFGKWIFFHFHFLLANVRNYENCGFTVVCILHGKLPNDITITHIWGKLTYTRSALKIKNAKRYPQYLPFFRRAGGVKIKKRRVRSRQFAGFASNFLFRTEFNTFCKVVLHTFESWSVR